MAARRRSIEILPVGKLSDDRTGNLWVRLAGADFCLWLCATESAPPSDFRCTLNMRHSSGDVGFLPDSVCLSRRFGPTGTMAIRSLVTQSGPWRSLRLPDPFGEVLVASVRIFSMPMILRHFKNAIFPSPGLASSCPEGPLLSPSGMPPE